MQNPKVLGAAGLVLLLLGGLSMALVYLRPEVTAESIQLAAGAGVLFALGTSTLAITGLKRLELKVLELEKQLAAKK